VPWTPVELPHCFNARDAVDPDVRYYQGPGWYRLRLKLDDAFPTGRVLLHFNGAGQRTRIYVGLELVGEHVGGYDEWTVDLTAAARAAAARSENREGIPLAVWCDNSRDAETIPSDLSDFNRYGGLYRHVTLVQLPAVALARVHVVTRITPSGAAAVQVRARLHNPAASTVPLAWRVELRNPDGVLVYHTAGSGSVWDGWLTLGLRFQGLDGILRWDPRIEKIKITGGVRSYGNNLQADVPTTAIPTYNHESPGWRPGIAY
jgi:beta-galactosidase